MQKRLFSIIVLVSVFALAACGQVSQPGQEPAATAPATATATPVPKVVNVYFSVNGSKPTDNSVTALNGLTGKPLWSQLLNDPMVQSSPVLAQGVVYVPGSKSLSAFAAQDGKRLWKYEIAGFVRVLGIVNGVVYGDTLNYANGATNTIFALNASDGAARWKHQTTDFLGSGLLADGVIYETANKHDCQCSNPHTFLLALNASDGSVKWQTPQADDHFSFGQASNGLLYGLESQAEGPTNYIQARSAGDGSVAWQFPKDSESVSIIGLENTSLYVLASDLSNFPSPGQSTVYALNATTGATLWRTPLSSTTSLIATLLNGVIYLGASDGTTLTALNGADGKQLWQTPLGSPGNAFPKLVSAQVVVDGVVYASVPNGFAALKVSDGSVKWRVPVNGFPSITAVVNGVVYGGTSATDTGGGQNAIYALKASDGSTLWRYDLSSLLIPPVVG